MVAAGLKQAGHRTALFTSPHLHRYVERMRINGRVAGEKRVARRITRIRRALERPGAPELSFFETTVLVAFEIFAESKCEVGVLAVGLGGRLDATNVITPDLTVITRLAVDHENVLGHDLGRIASEKAGILKEGVPLVSSVRGIEARDAIADRAKELSVPVWWIDEDFGARPSGRRGRADLGVRNRWLEAVRVPLRGAHQLDNAACAAAALVRLRDAGWNVSDDALVRGMERTRWPGRLERIPGKPPFLLDCAHNPDGCVALASYLTARRVPGNRILVFAAMRDKEHEQMLETLDGLIDTYVFTTTGMPRSADPDGLAELRAGRTAPSLKDALNRARRAAREDGEVVVAGSIFLVAAARAELLGARSDPPIAM